MISVAEYIELASRVVNPATSGLQKTNNSACFFNYYYNIHSTLHSFILFIRYAEAALEQNTHKT